VNHELISLSEATQSVKDCGRINAVCSGGFSHFDKLSDRTSVAEVPELVERVEATEVKAGYITVYSNFTYHELISPLCKLTLLVLYEFAVGVVLPVIDIYLLILKLI
jgi:hypothetical protein